MKILPRDLEYYVSRLEKNEPFSFVRYGNGEWSGIFVTAARTGSGSQSLRVPGMAGALATSIKSAPRSDRYVLGMQSKAYLERCRLWESIVAWLKDSAPDLMWYEADVLHKASMHGRLFPFLQAIRKYPIVIVGPEHLKKLHRIIPYDRFISVKSRDCYIQLRHIVKQVNNCKQGRVFLISAGPMAKVLIHRVYSAFGEHSFLIDTGSLWDPYCGKRTRRYHKRIRGAILRSNLLGV